MSVHVALATAPVMRGIVADPGTWATGTAVPTISGVYTGKLNKILTFTGDTAPPSGTVGTTPSLAITWDDAEGNSGRLDAGANYTPGDPLALADGLLVAWTGGTVFDTETLTVALAAVRRLPEGAQYLSGRGEPVGIYVDRFDRADLDAYFPSPFADTVRIEQERQINPQVSIDYLDADSHEAMLYIEGFRDEVCLGEDYDDSTVFLWRHGLLPVIGPRGTFTRAGVATQLGTRTGLLRTVPTGEPRYEAGPVGEAVALDTTAGATNLVARFHGESGASGWFAADTATIAWDPGAPSILDQSDIDWNADILGGAERAFIPSASSSYLHSVDFTTSVSTTYTASIWLRGRGIIRFGFWSGNGGIDNERVGVDVTLTEEWARYEITGATDAAHDTGDIRLGTDAGGNDEEAIAYLGPAQVEAGPYASAVIATDGASAPRASEALTFPVTIPADNGTLGFWFYLPAAAGASTVLLDASGVGGSERFRIFSTGTDLTFEMQTTGTDVSVAQAHVGAWHHIAVTWERSIASAGKVHAIMYFDGLSIGSAEADWDEYFGSGLVIGGTSCPDVRFKEFRIDGRAQSAAEILRWYERYTDDAWIALVRATGGRKFMMMGAVGHTWRSPANPHQIIQQMRLAQSGVFEGELEVPR